MYQRFLKSVKIGVWRLCGYVYFQFAVLEKPKIVFEFGKALNFNTMRGFDKHLLGYAFNIPSSILKAIDNRINGQGHKLSQKVKKISSLKPTLKPVHLHSATRTACCWGWALGMRLATIRAGWLSVPWLSESVWVSTGWWQPWFPSRFSSSPFLLIWFFFQVFSFWGGG